MNIVSYNIRGVGSPLKRKLLSSLIRKESFDFCLLQETKLTHCSDRIIFELWGGTDVEWYFKASVGNSGGLIILWKKGVFYPHFSFEGEGFVGVSGIWNDRLVYIVNVYSSCFFVKKKAMWKALEGCKVRFPSGDWLLGGDFNAIRVEEERKSARGVVNKREMEVFNLFIEKMELADPSIIGKKFTWFSVDGSAMSRLDRFLLSESLMEAWNVGGKWWALEIFWIIVRFGLKRMV
ncbi:uncharacterized protein LOC131598480 [Vicia villosa]|uniref:uncharacterized protein LOC131598480 n=1 Tax=Vicia villosa TaxID=3911 RepID=UPI00273AA953|nr:uncharacterized protein LOC131598480 [Vicia villosa]